MKNNMKLILERWDRYVLLEQEESTPQNVGELLEAINSYTMIKGDKTKRIISSVIAALTEFSGVDGIPQDLQAKIEEVVEVLGVFLQPDPISALKQLGLQKIATLIYNLVTTDPVKSFLIKKIGEQTITFLVKEVIPGFGTILKAGAFLSKVFTISKEIAKAIDTARMDPKEVLQLIAKEIYELPDSKDTTTGFMGIFNVDDQWSAIIDDKVEMKFIQLAINRLNSMNPATLLTDVSFNKMLVDYLKNTYDQRTLTAPTTPTA